MIRGFYDIMKNLFIVGFYIVIRCVCVCVRYVLRNYVYAMYNLQYISVPKLKSLTRNSIFDDGIVGGRGSCSNSTQESVYESKGGQKYFRLTKLEKLDESRKHRKYTYTSERTLTLRM